MRARRLRDRLRDRLRRSSRTPSLPRRAIPGTPLTLVALLVSCMLAPVGKLAAQGAEELPSRLGPAARAAIAALVDSARLSGLPVEPLVAKAQEGVLKGAEDSRIVAAVATISRHLSDARDALGADASPGTLVAGAGAIHAGLTPRQLRAMRDETRNSSTEGSLSQALIVAGDLVTRGVASGEATSSLLALIARRATDADLEMMRRLVEHDIQTGVLPRQAVVAQARAITQRLDQQRGIPRPQSP